MTVRIPDFNGWYEVPRNPISRVGVFPYSGAQIVRFTNTDQPADPGRIYRVYRPEQELSAPDAVASFRLIPITVDHPPALLGDTEGLVPTEKKGAQGTIGEQTEYDPETRTLYGNLKIWGRQLAALIDAGKKELSCGFRCVYELASGTFEGQPFDAIQRSIRGNHIANVDHGRMGPGVAVLDSLSFAFDSSEVRPMVTPKKLRARLMNALGVTDPAKLQAAIAANPAAVTAAMDAEEAAAEGDGPSDPKVSDLMGMLPVLTKLAEAIKGLSGEPDGDEVVPPAGDEDMEPVLDAEGKAVMDAFGKPQMKKKGAPPAAAAAAPAGDASCAPTGMDAALRRLTAAETAIASFSKAPKPLDAKALLAEVAAREALAGKLSGFVGAFDAAQMTTAEVAKYGVDKLGIPGVAAGQEIAAVNAYLHGRTPANRSSVFALDSASRKSGKSPVAAYLTPSAA
jgi:hypothetical protein